MRMLKNERGEVIGVSTDTEPTRSKKPEPEVLTTANITPELMKRRAEETTAKPVGVAELNHWPKEEAREKAANDFEKSQTVLDGCGGGEGTDEKA